MILNRQKRVRVSVRDLENFLSRARKHLRLPADALTISLVTNAEIANWNRVYRGRKGPTDVLSFPANGSPRRQKHRIPHRSAKDGFFSTSFASSTSSASPLYLGDIAIAPSVARLNARRFGRTFDDEIRILILHGILHLMGYDHETDSGQMDRRERRLRRELALA